MNNAPSRDENLHIAPFAVTVQSDCPDLDLQAGDVAICDPAAEIKPGCIVFEGGRFSRYANPAAHRDAVRVLSRERWI